MDVVNVARRRADLNSRSRASDDIDVQHEQEQRNQKSGESEQAPEQPARPRLFECVRDQRTEKPRSGGRSRVSQAA